jgi:hypothetical protein
MTSATDERVARLYGLPLEEFTAERNALAAELRVEGEHERAAAVKALRKPSAAAWAVNQLVRAEPELVEALLGAGGELRQAHRQAASGRGAAQLRAAAEAERAAVDALVARAPVMLGRPLSASLMESIRNSLHAASSDDEARDRVRSGTLATEMRPIGLGPIPSGGGGRVPRAKAEPAKRRSSAQAAAAAAREAKAQAAEDARLRKAAAAEEAALQREFDAAVRALDRAEESYARAREAAEAAAERMKDARKRMREARAALADAQRRSRDL